jgi:hypothetical protein
MTEPPPHVTDPAHRDLWHAACQLLQQNMGLTSLCKVGDNGDDGWHNTDHDRTA